MKTWNDYKTYLKENDFEAKQDLEEMEELASIVSTMIEKRNEMGLSQRDLASLCEMPQSSIARIESFKTIPNLNTILKIFKHLGLTLTITNKNASNC